MSLLKILVTCYVLATVSAQTGTPAGCPLTLVTQCPAVATPAPASPASLGSPAATTAPGSPSPGTAAAPTSGSAGAAATVSGSGSTALQSFLQNDLGRTQATSAVKVSLPYSGVGSGQGQQDFLSRTVNYGVSDIPFTTAQYNALGSRQVLQIPAVLNTVSVFVNITGVSRLVLDPDTLARIFLGQITSFGDPAIKALNPTLVPPTGNNISIITRADNSGTTALFTSYLVKASPSVWNLGSGLSVNFPTTVRGVTGTNSVVAGLTAVGNSIGYATSGAGEAAGLTEVALRNFNGQYLTSVQANYDELANQLVLPAPTGDWSTVNLTYVAGNATFPVSGFSYYLLDANQAANANGALLKQLMAYLQTPEVQANAVIGGLRPLPATINAAALRSVAAIAAPATPDFGLAFTKPANAPIVTGGTSG
ncbi:hypothetical protein WJX74_005943 [Apatococcus lobatus]|uniref:PBP domain-containing protein n=1 Tax=Apatococcus lobatus TaxID=904363 RepID=A0AAW1QXP8_9CHLO